MWWRRRRRDDDFGEEITAHLALEEERLIAEGVRPDGARQAARRAFGSVASAQERFYEATRISMLDQLRHDVRYALRTSVRDLKFPLVAALTLALGVGVNTAIFTLINTLFLKTLPVRAAEELRLFQVATLQGTDELFSYPLFKDFNARRDAFDGVSATGGTPARRLTVDRPGSSTLIESVRVQRVSGNFFTVLGVRAVVGRTLTEDDDSAGDPRPVAVMSYGLWTRRFNRDPGVVGQTIAIDDMPATIVGVAPSGFRGIEVGADPDLWWPLLMGAGPSERSSRSAGWLLVMGRLRAGVSDRQARAEMDALFQADRAERYRSRAASMTP